VAALVWTCQPSRPIVVTPSPVPAPLPSRAASLAAASDLAATSGLAAATSRMAAARDRVGTLAADGPPVAAIIPQAQASAANAPTRRDLGIEAPFSGGHLPPHEPRCQAIPRK
jgi:hypothetical protein